MKFIIIKDPSCIQRPLSFYQYIINTNDKFEILKENDLCYCFEINNNSYTILKTIENNSKYITIDEEMFYTVGRIYLDKQRTEHTIPITSLLQPIDLTSLGLNLKYDHIEFKIEVIKK